MSSGAPPAQAASPPCIPDHELLHRIGSGSYGDVWLARNAVGTLRAVKIVRRASFKNERPYEREFSGMLKFEPVSRSHEGLMDILQVGRNDEAGYFYYVMELADDAKVSVDEPLPESENRDRLQGQHEAARGRDLVPVKARYHPLTLGTERSIRGCLPLGDCLRHFSSLAGALAALHRAGLIHRDVKPSNIIIVDGVAKLADIGLVADMDETRSFVGTEGFIPPEGPGTAQGDVYSLGKVLYEIATGRDRKDYPSLPVGSGANDVPTDLLELNAIISRACAANLTERYASAMEMHADLAVLQSGRSVRSLHAFESRLRAAKRGGLAAAAVAVVALSALALASWKARVERIAHLKTESALRRMNAAEHDARDKLYDSLVARSVAERRSDLMGRRFAALDAIRDAARIRPGAIELRNAAISALAVPDLRIQVRYELPPEATAQGMAPGLDLRVIGVTNGLLQVLPTTPNGAGFTLSGSTLPARMVTSRADLGHLMVERFNGDLEWWDMARRQQLVTTPGTIHLSASPDHRWHAEVSRKGLVSLRNQETGVQRELALDGRPAEVASFLNATTLVVSHYRSPRIRLVDVASGEIRSSFNSVRGESPKTVKVSPDEATIAACSAGGEVALYDYREPDQPRAVIAAHHATATGVTFHPDGDLAVSTSWDGTTRLLGISDGQALSLQRAGNRHHVFSPDGRRLAGLDGEGSGISIFECAGREICRSLAEKEPVDRRKIGPWNGAFSPDGRLLASASADGIRFYDTRFGQELARFDDRSWYCVAFSGTNLLYAAGYSGIVRWSLTWTGPRLLQIGPAETIETRPQWYLAAAADSPVLASAGMDRSFLILTGDGGRRTITHGSESRQLALSPDGLQIAMRTTVWDTVSGRERGWGPGKPRSFVAFNPAGDRLAGADPSGVSVWDVAGARELWHTNLPVSGHATVWSPDGRVVAAVRDGLIPYLLNATNGAILARLEHPESRPYNAIVFSPNGSQLACFSTGHRIHLWNLHALRRELAAMNLDWALPPLPAPPGLLSRSPPTIEKPKPAG